MTQSTTARHDLTIWRNDDFYEYPIRVIGIDLTAATLALDVRLQGDTPGSPLIALRRVTTAVEGIRIAGVAVVDGTPISDVRIRIERPSLQGLDYTGDFGEAAQFEYAFLIAGRTRLTGKVVLPPHAYGSDNAPDERVPSYGSAERTSLPNSGATMTISQDGGAILSIDGADLVALEVSKAEAFADLAATATATLSTALTDAAGYLATGERRVGVTTAMVGDPNASGSASSFGLRLLDWPMLYDRFYVQLDAPGTGELVVLSPTRTGRMVVARKIAVTGLTATMNAIAQSLYVAAGGTVVYHRLTGGYLVANGFTNPHAVVVNGDLTLGAEVTVTANSLLYAFGARGRRVEVAPVTVRQQQRIDANAVQYPAPKRYIIGTFLPRAAEMAVWQARGVNTVFTGEADYADSSPGGGDRWEAAWRATTLDLVRRVGRYTDPTWTALDTLAQAQADALNPRILGWAMWDEVDNNGHPDQPGFVDGKGGGGFDPSLTRGYVEREIANLRSVSATKPIFANLRGYNLSIAQTQYPGWYLDIAGVNWWGSDQYPNTSGGQPNGFLMFRTDLSERYVSTAIGMAADQVIQQDYDFGAQGRPAGSIGKPYLFHLATGRTITGQQAEQPARWRCLAMSGIIHGAVGHIYFPQMVENGQYISDDTGPEILAEMAALHGVIAKLNAIGALVDPVAGGRVPYLIRRCAYAPVDASNQNWAFTVPRDDQLPGPFEGCEIYLPDGDVLRLVLNLKATAQALTDDRWGYAGLGFAAYEAKAFRASAPTINILGV